LEQRTLAEEITDSGDCFVDPATQRTSCNADYKSTHGAGQSTITLHLTSNCGGTKDFSRLLAIAN
jgi:hypothetical protein